VGCRKQFPYCRIRESAIEEEEKSKNAIEKEKDRKRDMIKLILKRSF